MIGLWAFVSVSDAQEQQSVRALLKASSSAVLSSQISGRVTDIPFVEGQRFDKGDLLVGFDCRLMRAHQDIAKATLVGERKLLENKKKLLKLQSAGALEVALSEAAVAKAQAELTAAGYVASQCQITAPYQGRVIRRDVQPHETVAPGDPLISILDDSVLELELVIPSGWLSWLKTGRAFNVIVDETGKTLEAEILRLGAQIDPISQTVNVYARFAENSDTSNLIAGMSGTAQFSTPLNP
ncbi:efflux RND transporter periplasmic adaptor subunit [Thalassospira lucentensis]|uniref:efflux RND transporter periplasmic adaptor subunit n=1 Tax=Thalassospira lucentensis TaxID=168935 RepID=UPI0003B5554A|nr:efflux RND transporter periplasmic adaptor subunit [Thalassospira lucentensis]